MAPRLPDEGDIIEQANEVLLSDSLNADRTKVASRQYTLVYRNIFLFILLHIGALYGIYLLIFEAKWQTWLWSFFLYYVAGLGITAGTHRLWAHRSYKAMWPLRALLVFFNTIAFQNDIIEWSRDHRVHHKYSETDADPHNARRGFFFAHMGWLLVRKHPEVIAKGKQLDLSDLTADPLLRFQRKYYPILVILCCFVMPSIVPWCWNESISVAYFTAGLLRYCALLHATWCVNSVAHLYGSRPYDKHINPRQNMMTTVLAAGEGWHNYHHTFPSDYRASEFGWRINPTTIFIDLFALIGWAYDRKETNQAMIDKKKLRSGECKTTYAVSFS